MSLDPRSPQSGVTQLTSAGDHAPEVLIKVVSSGSNSLRSIQQHIEVIRAGKHRALETDDGEPITDGEGTKRLLEDWNLDLEALICRLPYIAPARRKLPKLVHKLLFSMPAGTPPDKLLLAVRDFAREEFGFAHRYALALHTDAPHPHVHVVVKAMSEDCRRLNIRKATLRHWRNEFARHLCAQGIAAMATQRAARSWTRPSKLKGIYRPVSRPRAFLHR